MGLFHQIRHFGITRAERSFTHTANKENRHAERHTYTETDGQAETYARALAKFRHGTDKPTQTQTHGQTHIHTSNQIQIQTHIPKHAEAIHPAH